MLFRPPLQVHHRLHHGCVRAKLYGANVCSTANITATGSAPVLALCRSLIAAGLDPDSAMNVYRAGTPPLAAWLKTEGANT
jgi:hypothetical protein